MAGIVYPRKAVMQIEIAVPGEMQLSDHEFRLVLFMMKNLLMIQMVSALNHLVQPNAGMLEHEVKIVPMLGVQ